MAVVLFVITIPTEAEETRLRHEFIAKKLDLRLEQSEGKSSGASAMETGGAAQLAAITTSTSTSTTTSIATSTATATATALFVPETISTISNNEDELETASDTTPGHMAHIGVLRRQQTEDMATATITQKNRRSDIGESTSGSIRDGDEESDAPAVMRKSWEGLRDILSSTKRKSHKKKENLLDLDLPSDTCMEIVLRAILKKFQVLNAVWSKDTDGRMHQILFTTEFNETYESILDKLHEWGIGDREGSTVSVMNCVISKTFASKDTFDINDDSNKENVNAQKQSAWNRFMNSVRSRLNVAQIIRDVRQDASITFDFVILLISAAILASFGLVEDSTIFLASSMLISPLMGPIIAGIFGTAIKDRSLGALGLKNELIGICLATLVGFVFGMIVCTIDDRYGIGDGLTTEMLSRCELHSLVVGVFTAIPSGAAAAVAILGGNIGSLVGVAISASLLPPAVNSGLLWALALVYKLFERDDSRFNNVVKSHSYSNDQGFELAILGSISMGLTILNVICVYIMGVLVLKVKEIAPIISQNNREFWKHDIKIARDLNKNSIDTDTAIIDEFASMPKEDQKVLGIDYDILRSLRLDEAGYQNTWSPIASRHPFEGCYESNRDNYTTIHRIERLYSTITHQHPCKDKKHRFGLPRRPTAHDAEARTSYKLLSENLPRCSTMPVSNACYPSINVVAQNEGNLVATNYAFQTSDIHTPTGYSEDHKPRKFIVTPAEDPLNFVTDFDEVDV